MAHQAPAVDAAACHRLVFLDETSVTTKMTRLRGRSRKGTRLHAKAPFGHWGTQTFIAGLRWAVSPEKEVPIGGPQASLVQDFVIPVGAWDGPGAGGHRA